ncbi:MAG TPA: hypothetical protein VL988_09280 [Solirubrobacteraceae bacterium]|nr:hypothetical protein [Solirubrobacteraceae bacterium]
MGRQLRRVLGIAALAALATAAVALAAGPKKGATYSGILSGPSKEPITLKVAKNGKSVTFSVQAAPLYCEGGGAGERQISAPAPIAKDGSFSGTIAYEFVPTHKKTTKLYVKGKFSGSSVKGTARSEFGLTSPQAAKELAKCNGSTTYSAKAK